HVGVAARHRRPRRGPRRVRGPASPRLRGPIAVIERTDMTDSTEQRRIVAAEDFRDDDGVRLVISTCPACGSRWFPPRTVCARCAHDGTGTTLSGRTGTAYASTVVRVGPRGFPAPYVLSYVDIDGVRVLAHTDGTAALPPDAPVELTSGPIGRDGDTELWSYRVRRVAEGAR